MCVCILSAGVIIVPKMNQQCHCDHDINNLCKVIKYVFCLFLGTFDVQQIKTITEMPPGNFCLYCEFLNGSLARGCFVVMTMNSSTANNTGYKETNADCASVCISLVEGGEYNLSAFDIEQDGSTYTARAAVITNVTVKGNAKL